MDSRRPRRSIRSGGQAGGVPCYGAPSWTAVRSKPRSAAQRNRYAVNRRSASSYLSAVLRMISAGSFGPGAVLFQSSVSR
jgi:hypothetical protein